MLVVPFGRRRLLGVVVDLAETSDIEPERLAQPIAALEADVPEGLVGLGLWVAREYVSTPARGLALVLPPGTGTGSARPLRPRRSLRAALTENGRQALASTERLGHRQRAALDTLAGGPAAVTAVARRAGADHSTLRSLERRGFVRLENAAHPPRRPVVESVGARAGKVDLTAAQSARPGADRGALRCSGRSAASARGHGKREDRGLPARGGRCARTRPLGDRARARDRAHAADRGKVRGALRRCGGGDAFAPVRARALRRVVADAPRGGAGLRRPALGGVRAVRRPRTAGDRRGARRLVQAGGRSPLRRARGGRAPRGARGRRAGGGQRHPAPREPGPLRAPRAGRARRRPRPAPGGDREHGRHLGPPPRAHAPGARRGPPRWREGDRAAQPARLVELPLLPAVRPGVGVPQLRRHARATTRPPARWPATTAAIASGPRARAPTARRCRWLATERGPSSSSASWRPWSARCRCSAWTPTSRPRPGWRRCSGASSAPRPACSWARRWWPRATTSPTSRSGWCSTPTPRCASPTSAPRSAPSRWWPSSPAAAAAALAGAG